MELKLDDRGSGNRVEVKGALVGEGFTVTIEGTDNHVILEDQVSSHLDAGVHPRIRIAGDGNVVKLGQHASLRGGGFIRILGNGNRVDIGHHCSGPFRIDIQTSGALFCIGGHTTAVNMLSTMHEPAKILIGKDCQFGARIWITASDMHSVIDLDSRKRINPAADVVVGDHVWFCFDSKVLKGVRIGSGSIIGAGAVVTTDVPENCAVAGNPARVVRENVTWDRKLLESSSRANTDGQPLSAAARISFD